MAQASKTLRRGTGRPCLGSPRTRDPELTATRVPTQPPEGLWRSSGRPVCCLPDGLAKESEPPSGTARPKANSRGRPRAGTRSRGLALASGEMSPLRPHRPKTGGTARPPPSRLTRPSPPPKAPRGGHHLRRTTQGRPAGEPQRPPPSAGQARKALGPRVRPRHPPGGLRDSASRVSSVPAQRSRLPLLPGSWGRSPARAFPAHTGLGGGPGMVQLPAAALGRALPGRARRANQGRPGGSCPARWPCGRGARALRLHG